MATDIAALKANQNTLHEARDNASARIAQAEAKVAQAQTAVADALAAGDADAAHAAHVAGEAGRAELAQAHGFAATVEQQIQAITAQISRAELHAQADELQADIDRASQSLTADVAAMTAALLEAKAAVRTALQADRTLHRQRMQLSEVRTHLAGGGRIPGVTGRRPAFDAVAADPLLANIASSIGEQL